MMLIIHSSLLILVQAGSDLLKLAEISCSPDV